jgi:hypothetical protein
MFPSFKNNSQWNDTETDSRFGNVRRSYSKHHQKATADLELSSEASDITFDDAGQKKIKGILRRPFTKKLTPLIIESRDDVMGMIIESPRNDAHCAPTGGGHNVSKTAARRMDAFSDDLQAGTSAVVQLVTKKRTRLIVSRNLLWKSNKRTKVFEDSSSPAMHQEIERKCVVVPTESPSPPSLSTVLSDGDSSNSCPSQLLAEPPHYFDNEVKGAQEEASKNDTASNLPRHPSRRNRLRGYRTTRPKQISTKNSTDQGLLMDKLSEMFESACSYQSQGAAAISEYNFLNKDWNLQKMPNLSLFVPPTDESSEEPRSPLGEFSFFLQGNKEDTTKKKKRHTPRKIRVVQVRSDDLLEPEKPHKEPRSPKKKRHSKKKMHKSNEEQQDTHKSKNHHEEQQEDAPAALRWGLW